MSNKITLANMPIVIAFDPGETTGVLIGKYPKIFQSAHILWDPEGKDDNEWSFILAQMLASFQPTVVVIESFRLYAKTAKSMVNNPFIPVQMIGGIKANVALHNISTPTLMRTRIISQSAASRVNVAIRPDHEEHLLASPHAKDAYMHWRLHAIRWMKLHKVTPE